MILPIALGVLGWLLTHYVDRVTEAPTVEYRVRELACALNARAEQMCDYRYEITNLSRTKSFGSIRFDFEGDEITYFRVERVNTAHEGDDPPRGDRTTVSYTVPSLMPNGALVFAFRARSRPTLSVRASDPVRMSPANLETFLVRYEMAIMSILVILGGLVTVLLLRGGAAKPEKAALQRHLVLFEEPSEIEVEGGKVR